MTITCEECGAEISDLVKVCPHCGKPPMNILKVTGALQTVGCFMTLFVTLPILFLFLVYGC